MKNLPHLIGLTGSIGMGKSTTAKLFSELGIPVWDADQAVHRLYDVGGDAVQPIQKIYPAAIKNGKVSRDILKQWIAIDQVALKRIEGIVHPLVQKDREAFIEKTTADCIVLDIPLLFETGYAGQMDTVIVVSAPENIQKTRVLARPNMSASQFNMIKNKQLPDAQKRAQADYVIETISLDSAKSAVRAVLAEIRKKLHA